MIKNIYITGIAGLLGSNLAYALRNKYQVVGVDLNKAFIPDVKIETFDLLNKELLEQNIKEHKIDVLIHTAAAVNVDMCEENPEQAKRLNTTLTRTIEEICTANHIKMIYISTDAVFDGVSEKLYNEEDEVNPLNIYGKTKYEGEEYVLRNTKHVVLRTNIYGYNILDKKSFGEWILSSLIKGETINMFDDIYFSPILVNELSDVIEQIIEKNISGLYHACGSGAISKYEFGLTLKEIFDIKQGSIVRANSDNFNFKAKRSKNMGMSNEKVKKELNINIRSPIESIKYFKKLYEDNYPQILKNMRNAENEN